MLFMGFRHSWSLWGWILGFIILFWAPISCVGFMLSQVFLHWMAKITASSTDFHLPSLTSLGKRRASSRKFPQKSWRILSLVQARSYAYAWANSLNSARPGPDCMPNTMVWQGGDEGVKPQGHKPAKGKPRGCFLTRKENGMQANALLFLAILILLIEKLMPKEDKTFSQGVTVVDPSHGL